MLRDPLPNHARTALLLSIAAVLAVASCEREAPPEPPAYLFDPRVPLDPELERLKKAGDDPTKILRPTSTQDLLKLEPGRRYMYVVLPNGSLALAPKPIEAPGNFWSHPVLANGGAVKTAGHLRVERSGDKLAKVVVDGDADTYCPTTESLRAALTALTTMKVAADLLRVDNRPPDCFLPRNALTAAPSASSTAPVARPSFGTVMLSVARRFEVLGRAHKAKRNDLALYQLEEIEETFRNEVPATPLPPLPQGVTVQPFIDTMLGFNIPDLRKALEGKDAKSIATAFESMSKTCNGCHQAAGRAYIEVPSQPGELVPRLDPKP